MKRTAYLAMLLAAACWLLGTWFLFGCAHRPWRVTAPHNFPPAHEWNAGLETSWINVVDMWRRVTAPKGTIYDPVMRSYQPHLGEALEQLDREAIRVSPPRTVREDASCAVLGGKNL